MKDLLIGLGLLSCPAIIFAIYGPSGLEAFDRANGGEASGVERGRIVYVGECAGCHGRSGEGTRNGPALVVRGAASARFSDAAVRRAVREGVPARDGSHAEMLPRRGLSDADVDRVLAFLRELEVPPGGR